MKILICDDEQQYIDNLKNHIEEFMHCHSANFETHTAKDLMSIVNDKEIY